MSQVFSGTVKRSKKSTSTKGKKDKNNILLSASGRMGRKKDCVSKPITLYLKKDIRKDMRKYCGGNEQISINYLIRKSLDEIIKKGKFVLIVE